MASVSQPYITIEAYLAREALADYKSEYFRGETFAMAGGTANHALITAQISYLLSSNFKRGPCRVFSSDLRVKTAGDLYTYPDVTVVCDEPSYEERGGLPTLKNPTLLVEVASPSTEAYDRGVKFRHYQSIESLRDYLVVSQDTPAVDHFTRGPEGTWIVRSTMSLEDRVVLSGYAIELPLAEIYDRIVFPPSPVKQEQILPFEVRHPSS